MLAVSGPGLADNSSEVVNTSTCAVIDLSAIPRDVRLATGAAGQVLAPDALHEARLTPPTVDGQRALQARAVAYPNERNAERRAG